jgi:hypothetical protein
MKLLVPHRRVSVVIDMAEDNSPRASNNVYITPVAPAVKRRTILSFYIRAHLVMQTFLIDPHGQHVHRIFVRKIISTM